MSECKSKFELSLKVIKIHGHIKFKEWKELSFNIDEFSKKKVEKIITHIFYAEGKFSIIQEIQLWHEE